MSVLAQESLSLDMPMTVPEAARHLRMSKARLAQLILEGELQLVGHQLLDRHAVESLGRDRGDLGLPLAKQAGPTPGRLPRTPDKVLFLMADWGGDARTTEVRAALKLSPDPMNSALRTLQDAKYIQRLPRGGYEMTREGWDYTERYEPPV